MSCVAPGCKTGYGTKGYYPPGVGSHHIPKDPVMRQKWIDAIPRANWKPSRHSKICSLHFDEDDYLTERRDSNPHRNKGPLKVRRLKPTAVPHIFPGIPPMIFSQNDETQTDAEGHVVGAVKDEEMESPKKNVSEHDASEERENKPPKGNRGRRRKELKEGQFDLNSVMPWKLDFNSTDKEATFWLWEQKWRTFYNFLNLNSHDEEFKIATLRSYLSDSALEILDRLRLPPHQANDVEYVLTALRIHAAKQSPVINARMNFNVRHQEEDEVFDNFLVDLLTMAKSCEFCEGCRDSLIRDRIIVGLTDADTISKLLNKSELTLQQTINICRQEEKEKLYRDHDSFDPYFDGDPFKIEPGTENSEISKQRYRNKVVRQSVNVHSDTLMSDLDDHTYSVTTPKVCLEELEQDENQQFDDSVAQSGTALVSVNGDQVIITMDADDNIQSVLDLTEINDQMESVGESSSAVVKTEAIEDQKEEIPINEPPTKETKRKGFKPKQTFEEYLAELGLEGFGVREKFLCHMCPMEFSSSSRMLMHIKNVHEKEPDSTPKKVTGGKCQFCNEEFELMKHLKKHISEVHKDYKPFACTQCPAKFYQGGHLRRHIRILHENERRFACDMCPRRFGERDGLLRHKAHVHLQQKCDVCKLEFENGRELKAHVAASHPQDKPHLCESCGKSFGNQAILNNHVQRVHHGEAAERNHECQACGARFTHYHFLLYHIQKMKKRACPLHEKLSESNEIDLPDIENTRLQQIKKIPWQEYPPKCKLCNITFTAIPSLRSHLQTVHAKTKDFECSICQKRFKTAKILQQHTQSIHLGMKPYECPYCSAKFGQQAHRMRHVRVVHEGLKEHVCGTCGKKYANKIDLNNHLKKIHDVSVTFDCPHCENKYEKKKELLSHLEVHEDEMAVVP